MNNLIFLDKIYFFLFIPLIIILIYLFLRKKNITSFVFFDDLKEVYKKDSIFYYIFFLLLIFISFFYVIILSNPNKENVDEKVKKNGVDIVLVFDISYSMEAEDIKPNRMQVARDVISNFLGSLVSDRVGVVVFSGKPFISIPLTFDYNFLKTYVSSISTSTIDQNNGNLQGTALGDAMLMGSYLFDTKSNDREKVMIIVTDGEANKGVPPNTVLKLLKDKKIKAYTIGLGGLEKTFVYVNDIFGNRLKVEIGGLDEEILKKIASETGGNYYRATSEKIFKNVFDKINSLEKKNVEVEVKKTYKPMYDFFYYPLILFYFLFILLLFKRVKI